MAAAGGLTAGRMAAGSRRGRGHRVCGTGTGHCGAHAVRLACAGGRGDLTGRSCLRRGNAKFLFQLFQKGRNRGFFRHLTADGALAGGGGAGGFLSFPAGQSGGRHRAGLCLGHRGAFPHPCQDQSSCHGHHKNDGRSQLIKLLFLHLVQNSPNSDFVPGLLPRRNRSIISSPGENFNG